MTLISRLLSILALLVLAACGGGNGDTQPYGGDAGGGGSGGGGGGTGPTPVAADIVLTLSASSVANNGSETIVATAIAIDANRNSVAGVPVTFTVDQGGVATASGSVTDASGVVTATIGIGSDHTNRTVTVTATSGGIAKTAQFQVVDSAGGGGTDPSDVLLSLSASTIANDGSQNVTATVTALDAKRNVLPGVVVSVSADHGATVAPSGTATDDSGVVTAGIGIGSDHSNRTITVTASAAGIVRTATLTVVDTPSTGTPEAADLSLALSSSTLNNGGTGTVTATATAVDSKRNALPGIPVTFTVDSNAVAVVNGTTTNASGVVTAAIGIGADRTNRVVTVTATSGKITKSASFSVVGARLTASLSPVVDAGSEGNQIEYKLVDTNGLAMGGQPIAVTAARLPTDSGETDSNGKFTYTYTAPDSATTLNIVASAGGDSLTQTVTVLAASGGVPAVTDAIRSASLTPSPSVISVNSVGSTANQVELRALFLTDANKPLKNVRVRFDLAGNANSSDGVATQAGTFAYSDASGVARGTFTPGQISSPTNGITVRACYDKVDFSGGSCPNSVTSTLTVASEALSVNIRTDNTVGEGTAGLTYIKRFVVMVVDAAGQAKADVLITPSVDLPSYYKGFYAYNGTVWAQHPTLAGTEASCVNEDVNRNGVLENGEDINHNGELDPRKADVAVKMVGAATTDSNGLAIVQIEYGKNLASWVDFVVTVTASGISGTEARARYSGLLYGIGNLPYPAADVTDENVSPAFVVSPYGRGSVNSLGVGTAVCTDTK